MKNANEKTRASDAVVTLPLFNVKLWIRVEVLLWPVFM